MEAVHLLWSQLKCGGKLHRSVRFCALFPSLTEVAAGDSYSMASKFLTLRAPLSIPRPVTCSRQNFPTVSTSSCCSTVEDPSLWRSKKQTQLSPLIFPKSSDSIRSVTVRSSLTFPIISPQDQWGTWTALFATGAFGIWYFPFFVSFFSAVWLLRKFRGNEEKKIYIYIYIYIYILAFQKWKFNSSEVNDCIGLRWVEFFVFSEPKQSITFLLVGEKMEDEEKKLLFILIYILGPELSSIP